MAGPAEVQHGSMLIGTMLNAVFLGLLMMQANYYRRSYPSDPLWIRIFVLTMLMANFVNTVILVLYMYDSVIIHFGDAPYLERTNWAYDCGPAMTGIIAAMTQFFYAHRINVLTRNRIALSITLITTVAGLAGSIATTYYCHVYGRFTEFYLFEAWPCLWLISQAVTDVVITSVLVVYLECHRTGVPKTDELVSKIIRFAVPTGGLTAVVAILNLVLFLVGGGPINYNFVNFIHPKLYSVSLMGSLNSRVSSSEQNLYEVHTQHMDSVDVRLPARRIGKNIVFAGDPHVRSGPEITVRIDQIKTCDAMRPSTSGSARPSMSMS